MAIRIERNEAGNCINFHGSKNPTYWNACLSGEVDAQEDWTVNVINDVVTAQTGVVEYEFYRIPYTELVDKDGNSFVDAQTAADYITANANVLTTTGIDLTGVDVCFELDNTSTSILMSIGDSPAVNSIKAVLQDNGNISLKTIKGDVTKYINLEPARACINNEPIAGGTNDIINTLNELFTVGAFTSVVISDPYSTLIADVSGVLTSFERLGSTVIDPIGTSVAANSSSGNYAGIKTTEKIDQPGEYFTFYIRKEGQIGFGFIISDDNWTDGLYRGNTLYAEPSKFAVGNSAHYGFQWSHWFHPSPNGSWTNYGADTSYASGPGWSANWDGKDDWLGDNPVLMRAGIDDDGRLAVWSRNAANDGWILHARSGYIVEQGAEFHLGIKMADANARVYSIPKVHLLEPAAPVMNFRYVESPDGYYSYPLFATQEEANYYYVESGGTETDPDLQSHTHIYEDDPTFTNWHMPHGFNQMNYELTPQEDGNTTFKGNTINWTEITTLTNAQMKPAPFSQGTVTLNELSAVNIQVHPQDAGFTTSVFDDGGSGLEMDNEGVHLTGTAPEVTDNNVNNPSDTYTITIRRTNIYGSTDATFDLVVNNLTAPEETLTGFTVVEGSLVNGFMQPGTVVSSDVSINDIQRMVLRKEWVANNVLPKLIEAGDKYVVGFLNSGANLTTVETSDFDFAIVWEYVSNSSHKFEFLRDGIILSGAGTAGVGSKSITVSSMTSAIYDYAIELNGTSAWLIACNVNSIMNQPSPQDGGAFSHYAQVTTYDTSSNVHFAAIGGEGGLDKGDTDITFVQVPALPNWIQVTESGNVLSFDGSATFPTLQAGYTYRLLMGEHLYIDQVTDTHIHADEIIKFTADGSTEYDMDGTWIQVGTPGTANSYIQFTVPSDVPPLHWYGSTSHNPISLDGAYAIAISGSTYVVTVTGITMEGPTANQTGNNGGNWMNQGQRGFVSVNETVSPGERITFPTTFITDLIETAGTAQYEWYMGLEDANFDVNSYNLGYPGNMWEGGVYVKFTYTQQTVYATLYGGNYSHASTINSTAVASSNSRFFFEISNSGDRVRAGFSQTSTGDDLASTAYADWSNKKVVSLDTNLGLTSPVKFLLYVQSVFNNTPEINAADIDWSVIGEVNVPTPAVTNLTSWNKAVDFSGSSERIAQVTQDSNRIPMKMNGQASLITGTPTSGYTSGNTSARPWATAIVFQTDKNNSNQHIWNLGEGAGDNDDNIYLRTDSAGKLYFGWGRSGALNECLIHPNGTNSNWTMSTGNWYGIYIAHNGVRLSGSGATATNLAAAFDIRLMGSSVSWATAGYSDTNLSIATNWITTGGRMDRGFTGEMTIGGRGSNRNFHGKIASFVTTTLRRGVAMPTNNEIELIITDPTKWLQDYKVGKDFRLPWEANDAGFNFSLNDGSSAYSCQVWLMGDGNLDNYSNMIRNQVQPNDQNYTKANLISMVSNDIENVNIPGLSQN